MESTRTVDNKGNIYYKNSLGDFHRTDGPAYESPLGYKAWWINGIRHREDGPATVYDKNSLFYGEDDYYLNGMYYSKEEYQKEVLKLRLERLKDL